MVKRFLTSFLRASVLVGADAKVMRENKTHILPCCTYIQILESNYWDLKLKENAQKTTQD